MKIQKTKNEIILDLLERKDEIVNEKNDYLWKYQEWVMNVPYKVATLIVTHGTLEKISDTFSLRKKWWGNLIYKVLLVFF